MAIPNLFKPFWENCQKKFGMAIFGQIWPKMAIPNLFKPFWYKKTGGNLQWPKMGILNLFKCF